MKNRWHALIPPAIALLSICLGAAFREVPAEAPIEGTRLEVPASVG